MLAARPPGAPKQKLPLPALTGFRFVLALWVILHHLTGRGMMLEPLARTLPAGAYGLVRGGYLAVATFFVLSGFVLARGYAIASWDRASLARYAAGRFARIYPVYAASLLLISPFIAAEWPRLRGQGSFLLVDYGLLLQGWTGKLPVNWNTPAWSLSCEAFFYLCFPLAVVLVGAGRYRLTAGVAAVWLLPEVMACFHVPDMLKPVIHFSDFLAGIVAARAYEWLLRRPHPAGYWLYIPGLIGGAISIAHPEWLFGIATLNDALRPLNAVVLVGLALGGGIAAQALSSRLAVYLGKSSYAMYILHIPLLWWYQRWTPRWHGPAAAISGLVYVGLVVATSAAVYRYLEEPANRSLRRWLCARIG